MKRGPPAWTKTLSLQEPPSGPFDYNDLTWNIVRDNGQDVYVARISKARVRCFVRGEEIRGRAGINRKAQGQLGNRPNVAIDDIYHCYCGDPSRKDQRDRMLAPLDVSQLVQRDGQKNSRRKRIEMGQSVKVGCKYRFRVKAYPNDVEGVYIKFAANAHHHHNKDGELAHPGPQTIKKLSKECRDYFLHRLLDKAPISQLLEDNRARVLHPFLTPGRTMDEAVASMRAKAENPQDYDATYDDVRNVRCSRLDSGWEKSPDNTPSVLHQDREDQQNPLNGRDQRLVPDICSDSSTADTCGCRVVCEQPDCTAPPCQPKAMSEDALKWHEKRCDDLYARTAELVKHMPVAIQQQAANIRLQVLANLVDTLEKLSIDHGFVSERPACQGSGSDAEVQCGKRHKSWVEPERSAEPPQANPLKRNAAAIQSDLGSLARFTVASEHGAISVCHARRGPRTACEPAAADAACADSLPLENSPPHVKVASQPQLAPSPPRGSSSLQQQLPS